jgi:hypothetical protein
MSFAKRWITGSRWAAASRSPTGDGTVGARSGDGVVSSSVPILRPRRRPSQAAPAGGRASAGGGRSPPPCARAPAPPPARPPASGDSASSGVVRARSTSIADVSAGSEPSARDLDHEADRHLARHRVGHREPHPVLGTSARARPCDRIVDECLEQSSAAANGSDARTGPLHTTASADERTHGWWSPECRVGRLALVSLAPCTASAMPCLRQLPHLHDPIRGSRIGVQIPPPASRSDPPPLR